MFVLFGDRHITNVSEIFYAGYLLKRSNKPLQKTLPFAPQAEDQLNQHQPPTAKWSTSPPSNTFLRHRAEVDVFNTSDLDMSSASSNLQLSPNLPQHKQLGRNHHADSELQEFAHAFLGIDNSFGLFAAAATNSDALQSIASSPLSTQTPPIRRTEPLQIPTPDSHYAKRDSFRQTRRSSEPTLHGANHSPGSASYAHNGTPTDVFEPDEHVWRAKYCVLENGNLYFYQRQSDAESAEAKMERHQLLNDVVQSNGNCLDNGAAVATATANDVAWRPSLAMSPMHRNELAFVNTHHGSDETPPNFPRICEKYVALSNVGAVRSAEIEHGPHSFLLASEDEDPLILRAQSGEDMNEWIFQFHRSIASYVMGIMESCSSARSSARAGKGNGLSGRNDISPELAMTLSPRIHKAILASGSLGPAAPSLNHGHGRTQLHRKRNSASLRMAQSFQDNTSPIHGGLPLLPFQQQQTQAAWTPPRGPQHLFMQQQQPSPKESSPEFSAPQSDYPETERPPPTKPGKYVPPHMRMKESLSPAECISLQTREQSAPRYVPPHLRTSSSKYTPPSLRNNHSPAYCSHERSNNLSPQHAPEATEEDQDEDGLMDHPMMFDESDFDEILCSQGIKLGGCADPALVVGSILDAVYIPRKSSRLDKSPSIPFGCRSSKEDGAMNTLHIEIGAVSECGIRDSNEDAYFVASDVLLASMQAGVDMSETVWGLNDSIHAPGLFAVFDGHCGDHAARFAAERLMSYIQSHSIVDANMEGTQSDRIKDVLEKAIRQLDDEFCNVCVSEGRQWESGATALVAALVNEQLVIANLGDARGVICRSVTDANGMGEDGWTELPSADYSSTKGRVFWKQVTSTHCPAREDERARIESANGWITFEKEIPVGQFQRMALFDQDVVDILKRCFADRIQASPKAAAPQRILQISRVCGELAVSRAIGDRDFKSAHNRAGNPSRPTGVDIDGEWHNSSLFLPYPENHCRSFVGDLVSNLPDFEAVHVGGPGVTDEFLLLCCDGLWDVMDSDDAVRVARDLLVEKGWSAKQAANRLAELAVHLGSSDNVTVIVIRFSKSSSI